MLFRGVLFGFINEGLGVEESGKMLASAEPSGHVSCSQPPLCVLRRAGRPAVSRTRLAPVVPGFGEGGFDWKRHAGISITWRNFHSEEIRQNYTHAHIYIISISHTASVSLLPAKK